MADVQVISSDQLDDNTPQTPGLTRLVAIDSSTQAQQLSAFRADVAPGAATGAHRARAQPAAAMDSRRGPGSGVRSA
jgi:hypothetical protein